MTILNMRNRTMTMLAYTLLLSATLMAQPEKTASVDDAVPLTVSAAYSDAGPYGVLWMAYIAPDGDLSVRVSHLQASGNTSSHYLANRERVALLRRALEESRFFQLRNDISPEKQQFHRPHFRLTVTLGSKQHSVALYDPKLVHERDEVKRFIVVWDALFSKLPFKPVIDVAP